jgi:Ala-tRNA(Pro) deacylase
MTDVYKKIIAKLDEAGVEYQTTEHSDGPHDSSNSFGYTPETAPHHNGAKAILIKGKKTGNFYHFVLPDDIRLDQKKVKAIIGERFSFASPEELIEQTGCVTGSLPPFGSCVGFETHVDKSLSDNESIHFNAGSLTNSVQLRYEDYITVEKPEIVDIAQA